MGGAEQADDAQAWITALRTPIGENAAVLERLHDLLLRGARHECTRRRGELGELGSEELTDLVRRAADDALIAILGRLDDFRGTSRFTTWASKFAVLEAGVKCRRRAWQGRDVDLDGGAAAVPAALREAMGSALTDHERRVFCALALNGVPIDVLAERLDTTRGALYGTLQEARRKLRTELADSSEWIGARQQLVTSAARSESR